MEHIEGESLAAFLASRSSLSAANWWPWFDRLLDGLAHVHGHGYPHRDIKPGNVVLRAWRPSTAGWRCVRTNGRSQSTRGVHCWQILSVSLPAQGRATPRRWSGCGKPPTWEARQRSSPWAGCIAEAGASNGTSGRRRRGSERPPSRETQKHSSSSARCTRTAKASNRTGWKPGFGTPRRPSKVSSWRKPHLTLTPVSDESRCEEKECENAGRYARLMRDGDLMMSSWADRVTRTGMRSSARLETAALLALGALTGNAHAQPDLTAIENHIVVVRAFDRTRMARARKPSSCTPPPRRRKRS